MSKGNDTWVKLYRNDEWAEENKEKKKICGRCRYGIWLSGTICCDYFCKTGIRRGCRYYECKEKGIFKPRGRRRSKWDKDRKTSTQPS